ncbi:MAG: hypothetical protein HFH84_01780 [Lachnospiraceae bacterium]|nr:hypothetical protein [Lachnospiraceae bacterium]
MERVRKNGFGRRIAEAVLTHSFHCGPGSGEDGNSNAADTGQEKWSTLQLT